MRLLMAVLTILAFVDANAKKIKTLELNGKNTVIFNEYINVQSTDRLMSVLLGKETLNEDKEMYILIASPGGEVFYSHFIKLYLAQNKNIKLVCRYCASGAGYFFSTGENTRYVTKSSEILLHEMYLPRFTARMLEIPGMLESFRAGSEQFDKEIYTKMGISKEEYSKLITNKDHVIRGQEIIKNKLADELIKIKCDDYLKILAPNTCSEL